MNLIGSKTNKSKLVKIGKKCPNLKITITILSHYMYEKVKLLTPQQQKCQNEVLGFREPLWMSLCTLLSLAMR